DQVSAHRGLVQPVVEIAARCRAAGVPLWVDAAQALGHVDCATGADAVYSTSRKWLAGPRGVGVLAVAERHWDVLNLRRRAKHPADLPPMRTLESEEAHVAGRVGLAQAVLELMDSGPAEVVARLDEVGRLTREAAAGLDGWAVVGNSPARAITALRPTRGQDVLEARHHLLTDHRILTTAALPWRAPGELAPGALRLSPHVDCTDDDLARVVAALAEL
ncbi:MAG: aminotransferase class V-fold PLP-dependent enzyme, partial [Nocardioides sp.]